MPLLPQHYQDHKDYCGAAVAMMVLQGMGSPPSSGVIRQKPLYDEARNFADGILPPSSGNWAVQPRQLAEILNHHLSWPTPIEGTLRRRKYEHFPSETADGILTQVDRSLGNGIPAPLLVRSLHWVVVCEKSESPGGQKSYIVRDPWPPAFPPAATDFVHAAGVDCPCQQGAGTVEVMWQPADQLKAQVDEARVALDLKGFTDFYRFTVVPVDRVVGTEVLARAAAQVVRVARAIVRPFRRPSPPAPEPSPAPSLETAAPVPAPAPPDSASIRQALIDAGLTARPEWREALEEGDITHRTVSCEGKRDSVTLVALPGSGGRSVLAWLSIRGDLIGSAVVRDWPGILPGGSVRELLLRHHPVAVLQPGGPEVSLAGCDIKVDEDLHWPDLHRGLLPVWPVYSLTITPPEPGASSARVWLSLHGQLSLPPASS